MENKRGYYLTATIGQRGRQPLPVKQKYTGVKFRLITDLDDELRRHSARSPMCALCGKVGDVKV